MRNDTSVERTIATGTPITDDLDIINNTEKIDPGEAGLTSPALNILKMKTPVIPPPINAKISLGFMKIYGK